MQAADWLAFSTDLAQDPSQGTELPIVGRLSHLRQYSQDNPSEIWPETRLLDDSRAHQIGSGD